MASYCEEENCNESNSGVLLTWVDLWVTISSNGHGKWQWQRQRQKQKQGQRWY
ncbi:hypothetical protein CsSME_00048160 [Camellia sinensis var. sinensis]